MKAALKDVSEATSADLIAYLGKGRSSHPLADADAVRSTCNSPEEVARRLTDVDLVLEVLSGLKPDWSANADLVSAGQWARKEMATRVPGLSKTALDALEWAFTWWWR